MGAHKAVRVGPCQHSRNSIENQQFGVIWQAPCGNVRVCPASRKARYSRDRKRLAGVHYFAPPILITATAPIREVDARFEARRFVRTSIRAGRTVHASVRANPESIAHLMRDAHDFANPLEDAPEFSRRLSRLTECVNRQFLRQMKPGYASSRHAKKLLREYGTAFPLAGVPEARLRIRRLEAGEGTGRPHAHLVSDFTFIDMRKDHPGTRRGHSWFGDLCDRFGLGHPQYQKRERREMEDAYNAGGADALARYLTDYLSAADPNTPWPWPRHQRTLSAVRGALPAIPPSDCNFAAGTVAQVARVRYGAVIDRDASYFNASTGEVRLLSEAISALPSRTPVEGARLIPGGRSGRGNSVPDAATARIAGPRDDHSAKAARHGSCSDSLDQERNNSARRRRPRWESLPASAVLLPRRVGPPEKPPDDPLNHC